LLSKILVKSKLYIVGVSAGPDSLFLLDNLRKAAYRVIVAHVNYKKRAESDQEEELVKNYCQKYSLPYEIYPVQGLEYNSVSNFQDRARKIRYDFFQKLAQKYQTKYIVVAHHFDDHLETYLLQKQRKSLVDYWGLPIKTKQEKYWILRPLLNLSKQQIFHYLAAQKITYATDQTNQLPIYQRNIIRQKLNNLSSGGKTNLAQEIKEKNQALSKIKILVKLAMKNLINSTHILQLEKEKKYSSEVYLRLLYIWINQATNGVLQQRKKQLLAEVYKQLFTSKKTSLSIELGSNFRIVKGNNQAVILPKNK